MFVVWDVETGQSDESMRFATRREAVRWIATRIFPWLYSIRSED